MSAAVHFTTPHVTQVFGIDTPGQSAPAWHACSALQLADLRGRVIVLTKCACEMQGTPALVLIDRNGQLRREAFGAEDDLLVAAAIATLVAEPA